jgi:hypothetical protein
MDTNNYLRGEKFTGSTRDSLEVISEVGSKHLTGTIDEQIEAVETAIGVFTSASTQTSVAGDSLQQDNCIHCHATYGHKIVCPVINRNVAEAQSVVLSEADKTRAHGLGIIW